MRRLATALVLMLAGCSAYSTVEPATMQIKNAFTVTPHIRWAKVSQRTPDAVFIDQSGRTETWTIDGEKLDSITFFAGITDGATLLTPPGNKNHLAPFRSNMSASEIMDLFEAAFTSATRSAVARSHDLRPATLAGYEGFRFEISYALKDDVDRELSVVGAVRDGKLYLIAFQGTKLYHYGKYLPEFEQIVASARIS